MTTAELIAYLQTVPPGTPVVRMFDPWPGGWKEVQVRKMEVYETATGHFGKFRSEGQQHRNDVLAVEVY